MDYEIQQAVANYIKTKAIYQEMEGQLHTLKERLGLIGFNDESVFSLMNKLDYAKMVLQDIEEMERSLEEMAQELESIRERIKVMYSRKKSVEKLLKKREKLAQEKEDNKEQRVLKRDILISSF